VRVAHKTAAKRVHREVESIRQAELVEDGGEMITHRRFADEQPFGNRRVLQTFGHEPDDLTFPARQRRDFGGFDILALPPTRVRT
jgi:hypothetical protein